MNAKSKLDQRSLCLTSQPRLDTTQYSSRWRGKESEKATCSEYERERQTEDGTLGRRKHLLKLLFFKTHRTLITISDRCAPQAPKKFFFVVCFFKKRVWMSGVVLNGERSQSQNTISFSVGPGLEKMQSGRSNPAKSRMVKAARDNRKKR